MRRCQARLRRHLLILCILFLKQIWIQQLNTDDQLNTELDMDIWIKYGLKVGRKRVVIACAKLRGSKNWGFGKRRTETFQSYFSWERNQTRNKKKWERIGRFHYVHFVSSNRERTPSSALHSQGFIHFHTQLFKQVGPVSWNAKRICRKTTAGRSLTWWCPSCPSCSRYFSMFHKDNKLESWHWRQLVLHPKDQEYDVTVVTCHYTTEFPGCPAFLVQH